MAICRRVLDAPHKKEKAEEEYKIRQEVRISEERVKNLSLQQLARKSFVFGPLDKMVSDEKLKQTVINEGKTTGGS